MNTSKTPAPCTIWSSLEHEAGKKDTPAGLHRILIGQSCPGTLAASFVPECNCFRVAGTKQGVKCSRKIIRVGMMQRLYLLNACLSEFFQLLLYKHDNHVMKKNNCVPCGDPPQK